MSSSTSKIKPETVPTPEPKTSLVRVSRRILLNFLVDTNWKHVAFKICAYTYLSLILWLTWHVCPFSKLWDVRRQSDGVPIIHQDFENYFGQFEGFSQCGIRAADLYTPLPKMETQLWADNPYCTSRGQLLEAMTGGGRHGFDAPYAPRGCHYRWYTVAEICAIFDRFDAIVFVGDASLQTAYNGLNILLRQDLAYGSLKTWTMNEEEIAGCKCDNQFIKESCTKHFISSSDELLHNHGSKHQNSYVCQQPPHAFLGVDQAPAPASVVSSFKSLIPKTPPSHYKPIAIIHSLTLANDIPLATASLTEFLHLADASGRKTPMIWIGPPAAGHIEVKGRKGNQEVWHFANEMAKVASQKDVEVLGMWNLTVQANTWDGLRFGEQVAITQAMMIINWLARLESS